MFGEHPYRFPRDSRLFDKQFAAVLHAGKVLRAPGLAILLKKTGGPGARFGVVVPKRFVPSAVNRNRSKRILREWFRHNRVRLKYSDCVIRITAPMGDKINRGFLIEKIERLLSVNPFPDDK